MVAPAETASGDVEGSGGVEEVGFLLRRQVPFPFLGYHVDQHGARQLLALSQDAFELSKVVAVDGADVLDPQFFEERARSHELLQLVFDVVGKVDELRADSRDSLDDGADALLGLDVELSGLEIVEVFGDGSYVGGDAHLVVVQDNDEPFLVLADLVDRFQGEASGQGAVSDDGHHMVALLAALSGDDEAEGGGEDRAGMAGVQSVVDAFVPVGEARDSSELAELWKELLPSRKKFVAVGLVADIPENLVLRCVEDTVEGEGELYDP